MRHRILVVAVALAIFAWAQSRADDVDAADEPAVSRDDAEVYIDVPGALIAVDGDAGVVEIRAGDMRIYADEAGKVEIRTPGATLEARKN